MKTTTPATTTPAPPLPDVEPEWTLRDALLIGSAGRSQAHGTWEAGGAVCALVAISDGVEALGVA